MHHREHMKHISIAHEREKEKKTPHICEQRIYKVLQHMSLDKTMCNFWILSFDQKHNATFKEDIMQQQRQRNSIQRCWSNKAHDNINSILISFCMTKKMNQDAIILFDIHEIFMAENVKRGFD